MGALASMMGNAGQMQMPQIKVGCAVCTVRALDGDAIRLGEADVPADSVTVVAGTPCCAQHGAEILAALLGGGARRG